MLRTKNVPPILDCASYAATIAGAADGICGASGVVIAAAIDALRLHFGLPCLCRSFAASARTRRTSRSDNCCAATRCSRSRTRRERSRSDFRSAITCAASSSRSSRSAPTAWETSSTRPASRSADQGTHEGLPGPPPRWTRRTPVAASTRLSRSRVRFRICSGVPSSRQPSRSAISYRVSLRTIWGRAMRPDYHTATTVRHTATTARRCRGVGESRSSPPL